MHTARGLGLDHVVHVLSCILDQGLGGSYRNFKHWHHASQAVLVHQLSKRLSQNPFKKNRGRVSRVAFHPSKPFFFVATQNHVRIYNLAKQVRRALVELLERWFGAGTLYMIGRAVASWQRGMASDR